MPRNIELKARLTDLVRARQTAERLATQRLGTWRQIDTYFHCPQGRLKLRQADGRSAELIAYRRDDAAAARASDYQIVPVTNPETLKQALAMVLGVRVVVDKQREVFLHHNVRIHLDQVQALGLFLEFEAVIGGGTDEPAGHEQLQRLCQEFGLEPADLVPRSYGDLLENQ